MREIKVRGYAVEEMIDGQWIIGTGVHTTVFTDQYAKESGKKYEHFVFGEHGWVEVHGDSIGEYTGLKDKNGKEVFEGDIVQFCDFAYDRTGGHKEDSIVKGVVTFEKSLWLVKEDDEPGGHLLIDAYVNDEELEIIGNIFNDSMLLEGDNKDDSQR